MKKVFYDSWIAKHLLFATYTTITLFAWVFTKWSEREARQSTINHECVHARQWIELTVASGLVIWLGMLLFDYSAWWLILSAFTFYIWYVFEYLTRWIFVMFRSSDNGAKAAYRQISFEREARLAEKNNNYLENSAYFAWIKLIYKSI